MELEDVKAYLEENKGNEAVRAYLNSFIPSFEMAIKNPEFEKAIRSYSDSYANKQVDAYKEKGFKTAVENEVAKRLEAKNHKEPWQIKLDEMELKQTELMSKLQDKELAEMRANNKANIANNIADYKLPSGLIDLLVSEETEKTEQNISLLKEAFENFGQSLKQDNIKGNNIKVPGKTGTTTSSYESLSDAQLYDVVRTDPAQKPAILNEITRRTRTNA